MLRLLPSAGVNGQLILVLNLLLVISASGLFVRLTGETCKIACAAKLKVALIVTPVMFFLCFFVEQRRLCPWPQ